MPKIEYIRHGIAFVIGDTIYVNEALKRYPSLMRRVLNHENEHIAGADYRIDLNLGGDHELAGFVYGNPSAWTQFLPVLKIGNQVTYDRAMFTFWGVLLGVVIMGVSVFIWLSLVS